MYKNVIILVPSPPVSHIGAYEVQQSPQAGRRIVRLYWKDVSLDQQNGPGFKFSINDNLRTGSQFVEIQNVSLNDEVFKLSSFNKVFCFLTIQSYFLTICIEGREVGIQF